MRACLSRVSVAAVLLWAATGVVLGEDEQEQSQTDPAQREQAQPEPPRPRMSVEEAQRILEAARATAAAEPTSAELHQRVQARDIQIRRFERQIEELNAEIQRLRTRNDALEIALEAIRNTPIQVVVGDQVAQIEPAGEVAPPQWSVQYSIGVTRRGSGSIHMLHPVRVGFITIADYRDYERNHIIMRGNFRNESASPWRYTFEIRVGDRQNRVIGSWRYQTPVLAANEIHQFEVRVPVSHVSEVHTYEVGNVVADNPRQVLPPGDIGEPWDGPADQPPMDRSDPQRQRGLPELGASEPDAQQAPQQPQQQQQVPLQDRGEAQPPSSERRIPPNIRNHPRNSR